MLMKPSITEYWTLKSRQHRVILNLKKKIVTKVLMRSIPELFDNLHSD